MPHRLEQIQRWMQSVITHADGIVAGIESDEAREEIDVETADVEDVISRSEALSSVDRLGVYGNAYFARLLECMRESFPSMVHALGEETFDEFAFGYLQAYPSTSYTLNHLADRFPRFLQETRPDQESHEQGVINWPDFLIDLATLELAFEKVFDGPGVENEQLVDAERLSSITPEIWPEVRLRPVVCLQLLEFRFPVNAYFTAARKEEADDLPAPEPEYVALTRRNYVVRRFDLSQSQYALLTALGDGMTVDEAIGSAADCFDGTMEELAGQLRQWFQDWAAVGFFQAIELPT